jgi:hypothetical protein
MLVHRHFRDAVGVVSIVLCVLAGSASAQGLLWELPEDGTWIRYEGSYEQTELRPDSPDGDLVLEWIQQLEIQSVGVENAEFAGKMQPCRWIEIRAVTGKKSETGVNPGPVGERIVRVLVPESRVIAAQVDDLKVPVSFIPIVKGYRQVGTQPAVPLKAKVLQVYPLLSLVSHFRTLETVGEDEEVAGVDLGPIPITANQLKGLRQQEDRSSRSTNEVTLWRSTEVPFGLAKWSVKIVTEVKDSTDPRSEFKPVTEVNVEMKAIDTGTDAQSKLVAP